MKGQHLYIDIFAGCGGLSAGLLLAGWTGLFAIEKNSDAFSTLKYNLIDNGRHFIWPKWLPICEHDINELIKSKTRELYELNGKITLVAGGPPCQGFSMAGRRDKNDQRNDLVKSYIKFIKIVMPKSIIFENVRGFTVKFKDKKGTKQYSSYVERSLKKLGYKTAHQIIDMSEYGVPQKRKRFILVAMLDSEPQDVFGVLNKSRERFCEKKQISCSVSVHEAISDLEKRHGICSSPDSNGFYAGIYGPAEFEYQKLMRLGQDENNNVAVDSHRFVKHKTDTVTLHKNLLAHAPIGKRITPKDHIIDGLNRRGVTVLDPNLQAPTITSIPDELIHYSEPRILSVREHARLQGFPDWYEFKGKYTSGGIYRRHEVPRYTQVGNAVPPLFAEQIGIALLEVLSNGRHK